jgi:hypothetical protein
MKLFGIAYENKTLYIGLFIVHFEITVAKKDKNIQYNKLSDNDIEWCWQHSYGNTEWTKIKAFAHSLLKKTSEQVAKEQK